MQHVCVNQPKFAVTESLRQGAGDFEAQLSVQRHGRRIGADDVVELHRQEAFAPCLRQAVFDQRAADPFALCLQGDGVGCAGDVSTVVGIVGAQLVHAKDLLASAGHVSRVAAEPVQLEGGLHESLAERERVASCQQRLEDRPHGIKVACFGTADRRSAYQQVVDVAVTIYFAALPALGQVEAVGAGAGCGGKDYRLRAAGEEPVDREAQQARACAQPFMCRIDEKCPDRAALERSAREADYGAIALAYPASAQALKMILVHLLRNARWIGQRILAYRQPDRAHGGDIGIRRAAESKVHALESACKKRNSSMLGEK